MKILVEGKTYTVTAIVSETVVEVGALLNKESIKAVVYCKDKERKPHKFLMSEVEKYED